MPTATFFNDFQTRFQTSDQRPINLIKMPIDVLSESLEGWRQTTAQPALSPEERQRMAGLRTPALQTATLACVDILRRRPQLADRVGVNADEAEALRKKDIDQDMMVGLGVRLLQAVRDGQLIVTEQLGEHNALVAGRLDGFLRDQLPTLKDRTAVSAAMEAVRQAETRRLERLAQRDQRQKDRLEKEQADADSAAAERELLELKAALLRGETA